MSLATSTGNLERVSALRRKFFEARLPVSGSIEPTRRCNLSCLHCYVGDERRGPAEGRREIDTAGWLCMLDRMAAAGFSA